MGGQGKEDIFNFLNADFSKGIYGCNKQFYILYIKNLNEQINNLCVAEVSECFNYNNLYRSVFILESCNEGGQRFRIRFLSKYLDCGSPDIRFFIARSLNPRIYITIAVNYIKAVNRS